MYRERRPCLAARQSPVADHLGIPDAAHQGRPAHPERYASDASACAHPEAAETVGHPALPVHYPVPEDEGARRLAVRAEFLAREPQVQHKPAADPSAASPRAAPVPPEPQALRPR